MLISSRWISMACLVAVCSMSGFGCSGGKTVQTGTVQGKVTLDGEPVTTGLIFFMGENIADTASAELQSDGTYSMRYGSGFRVPAADYRVCFGAANVNAPPPDPAALMETPEKYAAKTPPVPPKYLDAKTSGLIAAVNPGQNTLNFELKSK